MISFFIIETNVTMNFDKTRKSFQLKDSISWLNVLFPPPQNPRYISMGITGTLQKVEYSMVCCIQNWKFSGKGKSIFYFFHVFTLNFHSFDIFQAKPKKMQNWHVLNWLLNPFVALKSVQRKQYQK